ncbi:MAG: carboxylesterase family protein [Oscillospiraceae bacterium]|jgi:para-nitrobenzyl esterase|nr:carboxylesterase family protein [Oscillospiraceae bacterium]
MTTVVNTSFGALEGTVADGVRRFLGVPFAKAPVGALRFREPQPLEPWEGVRQAFGYAKDPIQSNLALGPEHFSEDCLYLNVWAPEGAGPDAPVMVWIPGGAFASGGAGAFKPEGPASYDCHAMAKETGNIVVSVSYRLNVFGFLNLSGFSPRFDDHLGMKDIVFALRWVSEAIRGFGGDPANVTVFGESAGGEAISALMLIDEAGPLFHKAIIQSNCYGSFYTVEEEREICEKYLEFAGLDAGHAEGLLELPYARLLEANKKLDEYVLVRFFGRCSFCPVADGVYLRGFPTLSSYVGQTKPVLLGSNKSEGNFQAAAGWKDVDALTQPLLRRLAPDTAAHVLAQYPELPSLAAFGELLTDVMYAFPKLRHAEQLCAGDGPVYLYRFDYYTPVMEGFGLYACHVAEMLPLFELQTPPFRQFYAGSEDEVHEIGLRMRAYWGNFARSGDPNGAGLIRWEPYNLETRQTLVINKTDELVSDAEAAIRERYAGIERILL